MWRGGSRERKGEEKRRERRSRNLVFYAPSKKNKIETSGQKQAAAKLAGFRGRERNTKALRFSCFFFPLQKKSNFRTHRSKPSPPPLPPFPPLTHAFSSKSAHASRETFVTRVRACPGTSLWTHAARAQPPSKPPCAGVEFASALVDCSCCVLFFVFPRLDHRRCCCFLPGRDAQRAPRCSQEATEVREGACKGVSARREKGGSKRGHAALQGRLQRKTKRNKKRCESLRVPREG